MRARYYSPTTMSFISADPTGFDGGMNWYLYASGNPYSRIDRSGYRDGSITTSTLMMTNTVSQITTYGAGTSSSYNVSTYSYSLSTSSNSSPTYGASITFGVASSTADIAGSILKSKQTTFMTSTTYCANEIGAPSPSLNKVIGDMKYANSLSRASGVLKAGGIILAGAGVSYDIYLSSTGQQSWARTTYNMAGVVTSIGVGAAIGGPAGAVAGLVVGGLFVGGQYIYDNY